MLEPQNSIHTYSSDWAELGSRPDFAQSLSFALDASFEWINDAMAGRYSSIESQRSRMLEESPRLNIKNRNDGFDLEAERLLAIQQKNSRGFNIVDINPGLLDPIENIMSLPYEFIFDGTNFMPDINGSLSTQFRTVNIPIAGNFLKVEFINEVNSTSNSIIGQGIRPYAKRKYTAITGNEQDLATGKRDYTFDNYARTKVYVNFNTVSEKPHIVMRSGDSFNTYFNEVNITLSVGAPKIRLTIGYNSEKQDGPTYGEFNSKLSMAGIGRLLRDSDTVLSQFSINEYDNYVALPVNPTGPNLTISNAISNSTFDLVWNRASLFTGTSDSLGYSVLWITGIRFMLSVLFAPTDIYTFAAKVTLIVDNQAGTQPRRVHSFNLRSGTDAINDLAKDEYSTSFIEPICVVIPSEWKLKMVVSTSSSFAAAQTANYNFTIDGYSLGELLLMPIPDLPGLTYLMTSKYVTDATLLSYYNRNGQISRF